MTALHDSTSSTVSVTAEERDLLLRWLTQRLREKQIEEHRTDALDYKRYVAHEEEIAQSIIAKLHGA
jgi:hypothetical protein